MMNPIFSSIFVFFIVTICGTLVSLLTSIFIRREAADELAPPAAV